MGPWNIHFFLAAIPFQIILIFYFVLRRQMPLRESGVFTKLMAANLGVLVSDLVAIHTTLHWQEAGAVAFYFWNIVYFICMDMVAYFLFLYMAETLHLFQRIPGWARYVLDAPAFIFLLLSLTAPLNGLIFRLDPAVGYQNGPLYNLLYQLFVFYLAAGLVAVFYCKSHESKKRRLAMAACLIVLMGGLYLRNAFFHVMIFCYIVTVVITVIFILVRNPDLYLDNQTGLLSPRGFRLVLSDWMSEHALYAFGFSIRDYHAMRALFGEDFMDSVLHSMGSFIHGHVPADARFYLKDGRFFLFSKKKQPMEEAEKKILARFASPWVKDGQSVTFDLSLVTLEPGLSFYRNVDGFLRVLYDAFAEAEKPGVSHVVIDEAYCGKVREKVHVWHLLDEALKGDGLQVFLQPLVAAPTGRLAGAEALVRLIDLDGRLVPPCAFIPAAEENGTVSPLGLQVFTKVCRFIHDGGLAACHMDYINVNVSPVQCLQRDLPEQMEKIRKAYGVEPRQLQLEITEQGSLSGPGFHVVERLYQLGYPLVLDDYGTGYSNAGRMKNLPLTQVKLDMSLIWDHFKHPDSYLPDLIHTLKGLSLTVVAEGVETKPMADALAAMGVDIFQGFYFSKPIPMDAFLEKYGASAEKEK